MQPIINTRLNLFADLRIFGLACDNNSAIHQRQSRQKCHWGILFLRVLLGIGLLFAAGASAATRYVWSESPSPTAPFTSWATAAHVIQEAVDAAVTGDTVLVTNGVYETGGKALYGSTVNRVAVDKPLNLFSVNGPAVTIIRGYQVPGFTNAEGAVRCVFLANRAILSGFTLTNGATSYLFSDSMYHVNGGGVWCQSTNAVVTNCVLSGNSSYLSGGGVASGTLYHCVLSGNTARASDSGGGLGFGGGGAYQSTLINCTLLGNYAKEAGGGAYACLLNSCVLVGNSTRYGGGAYRSTLNHCNVTGNTAALFGGGTYAGTLNHCIVYFNEAPENPNYDSGAFQFSCSSPLAPGPGNIDAEPQLASLSHLSAGSPCIGAGDGSFVTGSDFDGEPWGNPPSMGCDEFVAGATAGSLRVSIDAVHPEVAIGFPLRLIARIDGQTALSVWDFGDGTFVSNQVYAAHAWESVGEFSVSLRAFNETYPDGVSATATIHVVEQPVHYVSQNSAEPTPPYASWATAATTIQDAIDAASVPGALVLVTNGVYNVGERVVVNSITHRVAVTKPLNVRSVNGPGVTVIEGQGGDESNGYFPIRCVYLARDASLSGFTVTKGATLGASISHERFDANLWNGGGIWCGSANPIVRDCVVAGNWALNFGGGVYHGTLVNCLLISNSVHFGGAGAYAATLRNCTVVGHEGAGVAGSLLFNSIVYYNEINYAGSAFSGTCTLPMPMSGIGNITNAPLFVDTNDWGNLRLQSDSPCINSGHNVDAARTLDLDGLPRIVGGSVDMGAYEFQSPQSLISYAWLQQYGLPADGSADFIDSDLDGHHTWQEWKAWTIPTNALSVLKLLPPQSVSDGLVVTWQSVSGQHYNLERAINGTGSFSVLRSGILGQAGLTSVTDTNIVEPTSSIYRVAVP